MRKTLYFILLLVSTSCVKQDYFAESKNIKGAALKCGLSNFGWGDYDF